MAVTVDDCAAFLGGSGQPEIRQALADPTSEASRYFVGMQAAASDVPIIDFLALEWERLADIGPALTADMIADWLAAHLEQRDDSEGRLRPILERAWQELSQPLRVWFWRTVAEQLLDRPPPHETVPPSEAVVDTLVGASAETSGAKEPLKDIPGESALESLRSVSDNQWLAFVLTRVAERSVEEVAELLGRSPIEIEHWLNLAAVSLSDVTGLGHDHSHT
jgi:DNA-directed RNA polymerase specialized sigma24 family protein